MHQYREGRGTEAAETFKHCLAAGPAALDPPGCKHTEIARGTTLVRSAVERKEQDCLANIYYHEILGYW